MGTRGDDRIDFNAQGEEDWYNSLNELLLDADLRTCMGTAGREYAIANYGVEEQAGVLAETLLKVVGFDRRLSPAKRA